MNLLRKCLVTVCLSAVSWGSCDAAVPAPDVEAVAEVYGDGILIWLLSQGSQVDVMEPQKLREEWLAVAEQIVDKDYSGWENVAWKGDV